MRIDSLWEYIVFANHLNFSAAARELHISQSGLSKHIAEMENELGFALVDRNRKLHLTAAGRIFLEASIEIWHSYRTKVDLCKKISGYDSGELFFQEPLIIDNAARIFLRGKQIFQSKLPAILVRFTTPRSHTPLESLLSGKVDVALTVDGGPTENSEYYPDRDSITLTPIVTEPLVLLTRPDNEVCEEKHLTLDSLRTIPLAMTQNRHYEPMRYAIQSLCLNHGFEPRLNPITVDTLSEFFSLDFGSKSILVTPGVMQDPRIMMRDDLVPLLFEDPDVCITSYFVTRKGENNKLVSAFAACMQSAIEEVDVKAMLAESGLDFEYFFAKN